MNGGPFLSRALLLVALALPDLRLAAAEDDPPRKPAAVGAAARFLEAFRAGDPAAMRSAASDRTVAPHLVADALLALHEEAVLAEPPETTDALAAASAFAALATDDPGSRGLGAVVEGWKRLEREEVARGARLRAVLRSLQASGAAAGHESVVARVREVESDLAEARGRLVPVVLRNRQGLALAGLSRWEEAAGAQRESAALAEAARWPDGKARALHSLGAAEARRGRREEAIDAYGEAVELRERFRTGTGPSAPLAAARTELAVNLVDADRPEEALPVAERALGEQEALGDPAGAGRVLVRLGLIHKTFGRARDARDFFDRAIANYEAAGDPRGATYARLHGAEMRLGLGELPSAEAAFRRVEVDANALGTALLAETAQIGLGSVLRAQGLAEEAAAVHRGVIERAAAGGRTGHEARAWQELARDLADAGDLAGSVDAHERAASTLQALGSTDRQMSVAYRDMAAAYRAVGRPADAIAAARRSLAGGREKTRRHGEGYGESAQREARLSADVGLLAALDLPDEARDRALSDAFFFVEASRAALLSERLAEPGPRPEPADARDLRARVEAARKDVLRLAFGAESEPGSLAAAKREHDEASRALRDALARADLERRRRAPPAATAPVPLGEAQAALPERTLLVLYQEVGGRVVAIAIARDRGLLLDLGDARGVGDAAKAWSRTLATADGKEGDPPETLYEVLLAPIEPLLPEGGALLVSPDGPLAFLPFEAMARRREGVRRRAIERWTISYTASATVHATVRREREAAGAGRGLVALGDPVYPTEGPPADPDRRIARARGLTSLDRLPATGDEVREVAALFPADRRTVLLREEATRGRLEAALAAAPERLRALHVACHGFADPERAGRGGLVLSDADVLTPEDVSRMRVPADLVVLSACESGVGAHRWGEGVLGFVRAFLAAGASRVLVANRRVADEDARVLVRDFYRRHLEDGLAPAAALRAAKLARLAAGGRAAHPYAWSALVLWE